MALLSLIACAEERGGPVVQASPVEDDAWFDAATLDPPFLAANAIWAGVALLDYDQDGKLDIFFTNGLNHPDALYRNLGDGVFADVAESAGVASLTRDGAASAGDFDNDGWPDLVVNAECSINTMREGGTSVFDGQRIVYHNRQDGTFERVPINIVPDSEPNPLDACAVSLGLADVDGNGFLDIVSSNTVDPDATAPWLFRKENTEARDSILFNDGEGGFDRSLTLAENVTSFISAQFDLDGDGRLDLLLGQGGAAIDVERGDAAEILISTPERSRTGLGLWMGMAVADFDGDDDLDVFASNQGLSALMAGYDNTAEVELVGGDWINLSVSMMDNEGGVLTPNTGWSVVADQILAGDLFDGYDGRYPDRMAPENLARYAWGWGVAALDVNADGWMDAAYVGNNCSAPMDIIWDEEHGAGPGALFMNDDGRGFIDATWTAGVENVDSQGRYQDGRGIAVGDLNNDGYADYVIANRTYNPSQSNPMKQVAGVPQVFLSRPREGHWLQVVAVGTQSNRDAIGATVRVRHDGESNLYAVGAGGQTNSSSERMLTVGTGAAETVDVEVRFPSGAVVNRSGVTTDTRITIREDE